MRRTIVTLALLALIASPAAADLWDSDSFEYVGKILPDTAKWSAPEGYKKTFTDHGDYTSVSGGLSYTGLSTGSGMCNVQDAGHSQGASTESNSGVSSGAVYVSFLLQVNDSSNCSWSKSSMMRMDGHDYDAGGNVTTTHWNDSLFGIDGEASDTYKIHINTGEAASSAYYDMDAGMGATGTQFIVWKTDLDTGTVSLWIDPSLSSTESGAGSADLVSTGNSTGQTTKGVSFIEYGPTGDVDLDYLRIGDSWSAVVPEPATMALLGLGGLAALIRRRR
jgi:hypothetical protein